MARVWIFSRVYEIDEQLSGNSYRSVETTQMRRITVSLMRW